MAYVKLQLQDYFGPRVAKLTAEIETEPHRAVGALVLFLAAAELAGVEEGTVPELEALAVVPWPEQLVRLLTKVGFLQPIEGTDRLSIVALKGLVARKAKRQADGRQAQAKRKPRAKANAVVVPKEKTELQIACAATWAAYAEAYEQRLHTPPPRNAKSNTKIKDVVMRVGHEDAPHVAAFYVTHNSQFYLERCFPVDLLARDCEGLHTQWKRGVQVTRDTVRNISQAQNYHDQMRRIDEGLA